MDALAEFSRGLEVARRELPFSLEVDAMAGHRVADVALLLGLIGAFWAVGRLLKSAGMERLRPFVFASGATGILLLFFTNTAFYMVKGVAVDADGLTMTYHLGADERLRWDEVRALELDGGRPYPAFTDDTSLVLVGAERRLKVPRFVPGVGAAAAEVGARVKLKGAP